MNAKEVNNKDSQTSTPNHQFNVGTKTIPFDIELAKEGYEVRTRGGASVRILCYDLDNHPYPVVAAVSEGPEPGGGEDIITYTEDGRSYAGDDVSEDDDDLILVCKYCKGYTNIYKTGPDLGSYEQYDADLIYPTRDEAYEMRRKERYLATVPVVWPVDPKRP